MHGNHVIEVLKATLNTQTKKDAEDYLDRVHKTTNYASVLLQIVAMAEMEEAVRRAAAFYLKNTIMNSWNDSVKSTTPSQPAKFSIHEQDKQQIRALIVEVIVQAPLSIRVELREAVTTIIRSDYPGHWDQLRNQICVYLESTNRTHWPGSVLLLHCLVAACGYSGTADSSDHPLFQSMPMWLPLVKQRLAELLQDSMPNPDNSFTQKLIIKLFHSLVQLSLPLKHLNEEEIGQWVQVMVYMLRQPIPEDLVKDLSDDEKELSPYWKTKKWCATTLYRLFQRYGSPGHVMKAYNEFAEFFLRSFSTSILEVFFFLCDNYRQHIFVSKGVMRNIMNYLEDAVKHAFCWKLIKPHFGGLLRDVIFPLMCHTDEDEELFSEDPLQYFRGIAVEDVALPLTWTKSFLGLVAAKRKNVLKLVMEFALEILNSDAATPRAKDGALHMIGAVSITLLKRKMYKTQVEHFLERVVIPIMTNAPEGYRRARSVWLLGQMAEAKFSRTQVLEEAVRSVYTKFVQDPALPVQVEAILSILKLIEGHESVVKPVLLPHIGPITIHLLKLVKATFNDEVAGALREFIDCYEEEIIPIAAELMREMMSIFTELLTRSLNEQTNNSLREERSLSMVRLLQAMRSVLKHKEILTVLEQDVVQQVVLPVLEMHVETLYDEMLAIVDSITQVVISPLWWRVVPLFLEVMNTYKNLYFPDLSPILYNLLTVDKAALRSQAEVLNVILSVLHRILTNESSDEDEETHAAKSIEVLLLEHCECLDSHTVISGILEVIICRLTRDISSLELRTMCLQVVIAAIYCSPQEMISFLMQHPWPGQPSVPLLHRFLEMWIADVDCFLGLHNRKLCILGLLALMTQPPTTRPILLRSSESPLSAKLLPSLVALLDDQMKAYEAVAKGENKKCEKEEHGDELERSSEELESEEDDVGSEEERYDSCMNGMDNQSNAEEEEEDVDMDKLVNSTLKMFSTHLDEEDCPTDEYIEFMQTLEHIKVNDVEWYNQLLQSLDEEQKKKLEQVCTRAMRQHEQKSAFVT